MSGAKGCVHDAAAVGDQANVGVVQAQIENVLLEAASRQKRRNRVDVDDLALEGEAGSHSDEVRFAHALHEESIGELALELIQRPHAEIGADEDNALEIGRASCRESDKIRGAVTS